MSKIFCNFAAKYLKCSPMITNYQEYKDYICCDLKAYQLERVGLFSYFFNDCLRFQLRLRRIEWLYNTSVHHPLRKALCFIEQIINHRLAIRLGFSIPKNVFGPGLCIVHYGTIVVSPKAQIGKNCRLHPSTSIGDYNGVPRLGDNVYIGPGAKLFGAITIGDNVAIGANSVVNHSFSDNVVIAGAPAKVIRSVSSLTLGLFPETLSK